MCSPLNTLCVLCVWCVPGMSVLLNWDGAAFSCHHVHSKSRGGRRNAEMTLQIHPLAFHLLLTATWRGWDPTFLRFQWVCCSRNTRRRSNSQIILADAASRAKWAICCFDSPLIQCLSKAVFLIWKPVKTSSSIHMCLTAEARLLGYAEHMHVGHERDCGEMGHIGSRLGPEMETHQGQRQPTRKPESIFMDAEHVAHSSTH